jgi:hypothetical protein
MVAHIKNIIFNITIYRRRGGGYAPYNPYQAGTAEWYEYNTKREILEDSLTNEA